MKNKLLVTIDGIRKDRLGCYNRSNIYLTPNLTKIAEQSVLFDDMMASATSTGMCFASMFTGRYAKEFGRKTFGDTQNPFPDNVFRDLEEQGYKTIICLNKRFDVHAKLVNAFSEAEFWWTGKSLERAGGVKDKSSLRPKEQAEYLIERLTNVKPPFFAWIHLWGFSAPLEKYTSNFTPFEYDARVTELDNAIGIIFDYFKYTAEIFIGSDHGYALFEKNRWAYGKDGYCFVEPVTSVPFMVYNGKQQGINSNLVSQISLRKMISDSTICLSLEDDFAFCESRYEKQPDIALSVREKKYKLIYYFFSGKYDFYDLRSDSNENINYSDNYFYRLKRKEDGTHPRLPPYILRTDWDEINTEKEKLADLARNYYGKKFKVSKFAVLKNRLWKAYSKTKTKVFHFWDI